MIVLAAALLALGDGNQSTPAISAQKIESAQQSPTPPATQTQARGPMGYLTAASLAERCSDASPYSTTYCFAYLAGIHDAARAYEVWLGQREFCATPAVSQKQLRDVFMAFLASNPGYRNGLAASVAVVAMKDAFACPTTKP